MGIALFLISCPVTALAQTDSRGTTLDSVRITAERSSAILGSATSSITRISGEQLARTPLRSFADVLRLVPGFAVVDRDGLGYDAQPIVRGFYGGGEAEYVTLLIDGKPVSQLQNGIVAWDVLPPVTGIDAVEVLRGNSSSLWGDAAIGAIINIITKKGSAEQSGRTEATFGTYTSVRGATALNRQIASRDFAFSGTYDKLRGFRKHSERTAGSVHVGYTVMDAPQGYVRLSARGHWRRFDEPGALIESLSAVRDTSDPMFRFDETRDDMYALQLDADRTIGSNMRVTASAFGEHRNMNNVRTLALAPGFGDTRERVTGSNRFWGTAQLHLDNTVLPWNDRLVVGTDLSVGFLRSEWFSIHTGDRGSFFEATGARGSLDADGDATRTVAALFAQYTAHVTDRLQLVLGSRADRIADDYESRDHEQQFSATHTALSPKAGLSFRYASRGNAFVNYTGSFKAPTLDQLYDQRPIPLPDPPFSATTSNPLLEPQFGNGIEGGIYQFLQSSSVGSALLSVSAYETQMRDELDFNVETLRYVNIARSRHRGVEAGLQWSLPTTVPLTVLLNGTMQSVTSLQGANEGKQLKAIPGSMFTAGINTALRKLELGALVTSTGSAFIDDANLQKIPGFTRADIRARYNFGWLGVHAEVSNLFDAKYNTTAFLDPAGTGERYVSPAAGRIIFVGWSLQH